MGQKRPWRVELLAVYEADPLNPGAVQRSRDPQWRIVTTFAHEQPANARKALLEHENPGLTYRVREHVEFEARS